MINEKVYKIMNFDNTRGSRILCIYVFIDIITCIVNTMFNYFSDQVHYSTTNQNAPKYSLYCCPPFFEEKIISLEGFHECVKLPAIL
uniref:Uncharacterized protein n=1 Tax=Trichogramma kaykai TaxID=54128 RepID=A0ABD2W1E7_9HYME